MRIAPWYIGIALSMILILIGAILYFYSTNSTIGVILLIAGVFALLATGRAYTLDF